MDESAWSVWKGPMRSGRKHAIVMAGSRSRRERRTLITLLRRHDNRSSLVTTSFGSRWIKSAKAYHTRRKRASRSLGGAEPNGCCVSPRTIRSMLDRPLCAKIGAYRALGWLAGRCHTCAGMGERSRVSAHRRIMSASALVTMEITVMEFRQWEGVLRRRLITAP